MIFFRHQSLRLMQASNYEGRFTSLTKGLVYQQTTTQTSMCRLAKLAKHMNACDTTLYITDKLRQEAKFSACLYPPPAKVLQSLRVVFRYSERHEMAYATSTPLRREVECMSAARSVIFVAIPDSALPQPPDQDILLSTFLSFNAHRNIAALYQPISTCLLHYSTFSLSPQHIPPIQSQPKWLRTFAQSTTSRMNSFSSNFECCRRNALRSIGSALPDSRHGPGYF